MLLVQFPVLLNVWWNARDCKAEDFQTAPGGRPWEKKCVVRMHGIVRRIVQTAPARGSGSEMHHQMHGIVRKIFRRLLREGSGSEVRQ
jgi:hypothetical protein